MLSNEESQTSNLNSGIHLNTSLASTFQTNNELFQKEFDRNLSTTKCFDYEAYKRLSSYNSEKSKGELNTFESRCQGNQNSGINKDIIHGFIQSDTKTDFILNNSTNKTRNDTEGSTNINKVDSKIIDTNLNKIKRDLSNDISTLKRKNENPLLCSETEEKDVNEAIIGQRQVQVSTGLTGQFNDTDETDGYNSSTKFNRNDTYNTESGSNRKLEHSTTSSSEEKLKADKTLQGDESKRDFKVDNNNFKMFDENKLNTDSKYKSGSTQQPNKKIEDIENTNFKDNSSIPSDKKIDVEERINEKRNSPQSLNLQISEGNNTNVGESIINPQFRNGIKNDESMSFKNNADENRDATNESIKKNQNFALIPKIDDYDISSSLTNDPLVIDKPYEYDIDERILEQRQNIKSDIINVDIIKPVDKNENQDDFFNNQESIELNTLNKEDKNFEGIEEMLNSDTTNPSSTDMKGDDSSLTLKSEDIENIENISNFQSNKILSFDQNEKESSSNDLEIQLNLIMPKEQYDVINETASDSTLSNSISISSLDESSYDETINTLQNMTSSQSNDSKSFDDTIPETLDENKITPVFINIESDSQLCVSIPDKQDDVDKETIPSSECTKDETIKESINDSSQNLGYPSTENPLIDSHIFDPLDKTHTEFNIHDSDKQSHLSNQEVLDEAIKPMSSYLAFKHSSPISDVDDIEEKEISMAQKSNQNFETDKGVFSDDIICDDITELSTTPKYNEDEMSSLIPDFTNDVVNEAPIVIELNDSSSTLPVIKTSDGLEIPTEISNNGTDQDLHATIEHSTNTNSKDKYSSPKSDVEIDEEEIVNAQKQMPNCESNRSSSFDDSISETVNENKLGPDFKYNDLQLQLPISKIEDVIAGADVTNIRLDNSISIASEKENNKDNIVKEKNSMPNFGNENNNLFHSNNGSKRDFNHPESDVDPSIDTLPSVDALLYGSAIDTKLGNYKSFSNSRDVNKQRKFNDDIGEFKDKSLNSSLKSQSRQPLNTFPGSSSSIDIDKTMRQQKIPESSNNSTLTFLSPKNNISFDNDKKPTHPSISTSDLETPFSNINNPSIILPSDYKCKSLINTDKAIKCNHRDLNKSCHSDIELERKNFIMDNNNEENLHPSYRRLIDDQDNEILPTHNYSNTSGNKRTNQPLTDYKLSYSKYKIPDIKDSSAKFDSRQDSDSFFKRMKYPEFRSPYLSNSDLNDRYGNLNLSSDESMGSESIHIKNTWASTKDSPYKSEFQYIANEDYPLCKNCFKHHSIINNKREDSKQSYFRDMPKSSNIDSHILADYRMTQSTISNDITPFSSKSIYFNDCDSEYKQKYEIMNSSTKSGLFKHSTCSTIDKRKLSSNDDYSSPRQNYYREVSPRNLNLRVYCRGKCIYNP